MIRILAGGFSEQLSERISRELPGAHVEHAASGRAVTEALAREGASLLILEHHLADPPALEILRELRAGPAWKDLPVIFCLGEGDSVELVKRLMREFGVQTVMFPPLDSHELAWKAALLLGLAPPPCDASKEAKIRAGVAKVRDHFREGMRERLGILEEAGTALLEGKLSVPLRDAARREAHKLSGLLGTLGFEAGSRFSRQIEEMLQGGAPLTDTQAFRLSELVVALRMDLDSGFADLPPTAGLPRPSAFSILIVDADPDVGQRLQAEAAARGWDAEAVRDLASARDAVRDHPPHVILLDPHISGDEQEGLALLEDMAKRSPAIPVIVLTSSDTFTDRLEIARRGGRGFLFRSSPTGSIAEAAFHLVSRLEAVESRVMTVDDDPEVLALLQSLLEARRVRVATLDDPLQFWDRLESFAPDLVLLDVDMPGLSGVELCRVMRNDPRWADTPVLFLTRYDDASTIERVFTAGADDYIRKPIMGPELLTRVFNRLEQSRLRRSIAETDPLTGVWNRPKFSRILRDFLDLAARHGQPLAFALLDFDQLEKINRERGHEVGDMALQRMGRLLREAFRSEDALGRWDGERFAAGMYGLSRYDGVQRLNELLESIRKEVVRLPGDGEIEISFSAGVAEYNEDGNDLESLYQAAGSALASARQASGGRVLAASWRSEGPLSGQRLDVALVMQNEAQARILTSALDLRGCRSRWLADGKTAAKLLAGSKPPLRARVAFLDIDLPGLDGLSLLKRFASDGILEKTRVIVLTSPSVANEAHIALELGAFDCMVKPVNPPVVVKHIRKALEARRL